MKKKSKFPGVKEATYTGICKSCGEVYEAQSGSDDLEGVTFKCKKFLCRGQVSLSLSTPAESETEMLPTKGFHVPNASKKFC